MEAKAVAKFVRISPRKARQVVDLIRGKSVGEGLLQTVSHGSESNAPFHQNDSGVSPFDLRDFIAG